MTPTVRPLVAALLLSAATASESVVELTATGQLHVVARGAPSEARVFRSAGMPMTLLVDQTPYGQPVLITTGPTTARLLEPARVTPDPANPDVVRVDTSGAQSGYLQVRLQGSALVLDRDGTTMSLVPTPPVLGDRTLDQVLAQLPEYRRSAGRYSPDAKAVSSLRAVQQPTEMVVFFGSWCSHCEQVVPKLVRVLQDAGNGKLRVTFHGVPPPGEGEDRLADREGVRALPTLIVRRDGKEIARMAEHGWDTPEVELVKLVVAPAP
jgi:thiol-disulfide isomerase/thioredoxin